MDVRERSVDMSDFREHQLMGKSLVFAHTPTTQPQNIVTPIDPKLSIAQYDTHPSALHFDGSALASPIPGIASSSPGKDPAEGERR